MVLAVPERVISTVVSEGIAAVNTLPGQNGTQLEVEDLRGEFHLSWTAASGERPELTSVISATVRWLSRSMATACDPM